jgi:uncharacterized protein
MTDGRITLQTCRNCAARWYLERDRCPRCGAAEIVPQLASGRGTLFAMTTVHRAPDASDPYRLALVDLDEGVRVMAHLSDDLPIGAAVRGRLESVAGREVPVFRPVRSNDEPSGSP